MRITIGRIVWILFLTKGFAVAADPIPAIGYAPPASWRSQPVQPQRQAECRSYCKPDFPNEEEYTSRSYAAKNLNEALRAEQDRHRAMNEYLRQRHDENAIHYNQVIIDCGRLENHAAIANCRSQAAVEKANNFEAIRSMEYKENEIHRSNWEKIHERWRGETKWDESDVANTHRQAQQNRQAQQTRQPQPTRTTQPVEPRRQAQQTRQTSPRPVQPRRQAPQPRQPSRSRQG